MKKNNNNKKFSESYMGKKFLKMLTNPSHFSCFPSFAVIAPEVSCLQGKPDFIALTRPKPRKIDFDKIRQLSKIERTSSTVHILSLLKRYSPRTIPFLIKNSGYSKSTVQRALSVLINYSLIDNTPSGSYIISRKFHLPTNELWVFELKLNNWKRALFQALQCKSYATRIVTVFPKSLERTLNSHLDKFKRMKIGVLTFDPHCGTYSLLLKPHKNIQLSRMHYLYAFSQMRF
ncbi:MAG: hypothetical protein PVH77_08880 [Phycisphaerales bacterium]|jgi:hypothetical protein